LGCFCYYIKSNWIGAISILLYRISVTGQFAYQQSERWRRQQRWRWCGRKKTRRQMTIPFRW